MASRIMLTVERANNIILEEDYTSLDDKDEIYGRCIRMHIRNVQRGVIDYNTVHDNEYKYTEPIIAKGNKFDNIEAIW